MSSMKSNNTNIYKEMCKRLLKKGHFRTIGPSPKVQEFVIVESITSLLTLLF